MKCKALRVVAGVLACAAIGGGLASAANQDSSGKARGSETQGRHGGPPGPPPFLRGMTYAEVHSQRDGKAVTERIDRGKIEPASDSEVKITENDGSTVTIPVDSNTEVKAGPQGDKSLSDLKSGDQVLVIRGSDSSTAETICLLPPKPKADPGQQGSQGQHDDGGPQGFGPQGPPRS